MRVKGRAAKCRAKKNAVKSDPKPPLRNGGETEDHEVAPETLLVREQEKERDQELEPERQKLIEFARSRPIGDVQRALKLIEDDPPIIPAEFDRRKEAV